MSHVKHFFPREIIKSQKCVQHWASLEIKQVGQMFFLYGVTQALNYQTVNDRNTELHLHLDEDRNDIN